MLLWGIGPQYTHYFMPSNAYFSATAAVTVLSLKRPFGGSGATNAGVGTRIAVGREWWAGNHWGLGLAGQFSLSLNDDGGSSPMTTFGFGLAFSATYN